MNYRAPQNDAGGAGPLEMLDLQGMTQEQANDSLIALSAHYEADPTNLHTVKSMAELLEKIEDFEYALVFWNYALSLNPSDAEVQRRIEQLNGKIRGSQGE